MARLIAARLQFRKEFPNPSCYGWKAAGQAPVSRPDRFRFQHLGTFGGHFLAAAGAAGRGGG